MDTDDTEEQNEELSEPLPQVTEPAAVFSALNALEEHPSSQVTADTNIKQPRTLSTIDDVLVDKTQPEPEPELEDHFDYENTEVETEEEMREEPGDVTSATGEVTSAQEDVTSSQGEVTSAQQSVEDMEDNSVPDEDKENTPSNENERYVRQVVSQLPLSKIKKLMKMDPDTKLVQNDSVLLVAFATELFIKALSTAAARVAVKSKRKTIKKEDIETCVHSLDYFEFLEDML